MWPTNRRSIRPVALLPLLPAVLILFTACGDPPTSPPTVTLTVGVSFPGGSTCTPLPAKPCAVSVSADAGGSTEGLRYSWSGCATGTARSATCVVDRPGPVMASVEVVNDRGQTARTSASAQGVNNPPSVFIGYITRIPNSEAIELLGAVTDPEEGTLNDRRHCESVTTTGACRPFGFLSCGGLAGLEINVYRTASTGICAVTITVKDPWDERGTSVIAFDVAR